MESREEPVETRLTSPSDDPVDLPRSKDDHIESGDAGSSVPSTHVEAVTKLARMFDQGAERLDLAIMQVIAEGGSPSEWIAGMLRASLPTKPVETSPRPRFLGE